MPSYPFPTAIPMAMPLFTFICPQGHRTPHPQSEWAPLFGSCSGYMGVRVVFVQDPGSVPLTPCIPLTHSSTRTELEPPQPACLSYIKRFSFWNRTNGNSDFNMSYRRRRERSSSSLASNTFLIKKSEDW